MVYVLLGHVRIVPEHFFVEASRGGVILEPADLRADDAFQRMKDRTRPNAVERIRPRRPFAQVHRVVVSIRKAESNRDPSGRLHAQRVDELFAEESHRRRAEDDHPLLVQSDNPLIRPKIQQFGKVQVLAFRRVVAT